MREKKIVKLPSKTRITSHKSFCQRMLKSAWAITTGKLVKMGMIPGDSRILLSSDFLMVFVNFSRVFFQFFSLFSLFFHFFPTFFYIKGPSTTTFLSP